jgi:two-component system NarL family response regulator
MLPTPIKILLVEDDELFRLGLHMRLQQETGLEVMAEAEDGETAIELVNHTPVDVILLDVGLPGIGGIETCRQIKQQNPHLPILVTDCVNGIFDLLMPSGGFCALLNLFLQMI